MPEKKRDFSHREVSFFYKFTIQLKIKQLAIPNN